MKHKDKKLIQSFNLTYRDIDNVLSLLNSEFGDYPHLIYPPELEIKDTTRSRECSSFTSSSYLDLLLETDNKVNLSTNIYEKRDDFNFPTKNFHFPFYLDLHETI